MIHVTEHELYALCLSHHYWIFAFQVTENGKQERHLVATVGKFSVIWDFQQVKNSAHECYRNQQGLKSCYCYKIVLKDESIVESRFMHDKFAVSESPEAPLVVATPMKVSSISLSGKGKRWLWKLSSLQQSIGICRLGSRTASAVSFPLVYEVHLSLFILPVLAFSLLLVYSVKFFHSSCCKHD